MPAACIFRGSSRLSVPRRTLPASTQPLKQPGLRQSMTCAPSLQPGTAREHGAQRLGDCYKLRDGLSALSSPSSSFKPSSLDRLTQTIKDGRKHDEGATLMQTLKKGRSKGGRKPRRDTVQEGDGTTFPSHPSSHWNGSPDPSAGQGSQSRQKPASKKRKNRGLFSPRIFANLKTLTPEGWNNLKGLRSKYLQWGYFRHQLSKSEFLPSRRAFNSWKIKFRHVLTPVDPSTWPWREHGRWLFELETVAAMREAWESIDLETRRQKWPHVLLSTMHLCPDKAGLVLDATLDPLPPGYAIHDVLLFIAQRLNLDGLEMIGEQTTKADEILHLTTKTILGLPAGHVPFGQRTFGLLAQKLPADQTNELYTILRRAGYKLHENTLLQFASTLAGDMEHKETAFEIIKDLAGAGMDLNEAKAASVITLLLHCKAGRADGGLPHSTQPFSPKDALMFLVERGFSPNVVSSNALLDSLCQCGEVDEAMRLALLLSECGMELDAKTCATMFRGAKQSLNVANILKALDVARAADAPYVDVLNNALHSIFSFALMESRERGHRRPLRTLPLFIPMLRVYAKRFDLAPLQWWVPESLALALFQQSKSLEAAMNSDAEQPMRWEFEQSILPVVDQFFSADKGPELQPNSTTIATMMRSYIKGLGHPYSLMAFYDFFKSRLEDEGQQKDTAAQLVKHQGSLVHDTLIMAMLGCRQLARPALRVFGDMLKANSQHGTSEGSAPLHPRPTVVTFSILLQGLMFHGEHALAEQVLQIMDELGIKRNLVTWNTLVRGYAVTQDVYRTVATLQDLEAAGFEADTYTYNSFGRLKNQSRALQMMEDILAANQKKMEEESSYPEWASTSRTYS